MPSNETILPISGTAGTGFVKYTVVLSLVRPVILEKPQLSALFPAHCEVQAPGVDLAVEASPPAQAMVFQYFSNIVAGAWETYCTWSPGDLRS